jgi:hypothetical protein
MARHTRIKIAALATTFVAAIGIMAVSPAASSDLGGNITYSRIGDRAPCC